MKWAKAMVLLVMALLGCSSSGEPVCSGAGGTAEERSNQASELSGIVAIYGEDPERSRAIFCSGVLVGPRALLTAGHCVFDRPDWTFTAYFTADFVFGRSDDLAVEVASWEVHPDHPRGRGESDLAVVELATSAPAGVTPVSWTNSAPTSAVGARYHFVGYGGENGEVTQCLRVDHDVTGVDLGGSTISAFVHPNIYYGESGGPLLVDLGSGPIVLGILAESTVIGSEVAHGSLVHFAPLHDDDWVRANLPTEPVALPPSATA